MVGGFLILLVSAAAGALRIGVIRHWNRHNVHSLLQAAAAETWANLGEAPDGRRALVSFSTPSCAACHTAQAPAVKALEPHLGPPLARSTTTHAPRHPDLARAFA